MSGPLGFLLYENPPGAIKGHPEGYPLKGSSVIIILILNVDNDIYNMIDTSNRPRGFWVFDTTCIRLSPTLIVIDNAVYVS